MIRIASPIPKTKWNLATKEKGEKVYPYHINCKVDKVDVRKGKM